MNVKIRVFMFLGIIYGFFIINLFMEDIEISKSERRKLEQFPEISLKSVFNKDFMESFDKYSVDQFSFRDGFRSLKANYLFNVLRMTDNNGIFIKDGYIFKSEYSTNYRSIDSFITKMTKLNKYFDGDVYISIIPDKNYYLNDSKYLNIDYDKLYEEVIKGTEYNYIDIREELDLDDYYKTDTHWRQEKLEDVVKKINNSMALSTDFNYKENKYYPFYGVYYGQAALKVEPDEIVFLEKDEFKDLKIFNLEKNDVLYDTSLLDGMDPYDVFLTGATSLIKIENPNSKTDKELVLFRDSFGSSIAPLLIDNYKSITLVDLRYISFEMMEEYVDFTNKDVLILYSILLVNESGAIRID